MAAAAVLSVIDYQSGGVAYVCPVHPSKQLTRTEPPPTPSPVSVHACNCPLHFNPLMVAVANLHLIWLSVCLGILNLPGR